MAWKRKYRCKGCGYEAEIYEGRGLFRQQITAMSCPDCKTIQNIVVGGTTVLAVRQRPYPDMGHAYLSKMSGRNGRYWRKRILDVRSNFYFRTITLPLA